jgi:hypothetical protein
MFTAYRNQKSGNTFFGVEINVTTYPKSKPGNTFFGLEINVTSKKESPLRGELNAASRKSKVSQSKVQRLRSVLMSRTQ